MMRQYVVLLLLVVLTATSAFLAQRGARLLTPNTKALTMGLHDYSLSTLDGKEVSMSGYKGKVVLMENVATL